jgi:cytochrome c biogenesis protein CcdA
MKNAACPLTPEQADRRGIAWIVGSFVLCPCHLPITLSVLAAVLSGTAAGALIYAHLYVTGAAISILWLAGTLQGFRLMQRARIDAYTNRTPGSVIVQK